MSADLRSRTVHCMVYILLVLETIVISLDAVEIDPLFMRLYHFCTLGYLVWIMGGRCILYLSTSIKLLIW